MLYYGDEPMKMENEYTDSQTTMHFELHDIRQTSARSMIASPYPEEVLMAVLGNYGKESPETIIAAIFERLKVLAKSEVDFQKYSERLIILAKSRKFEQIAVKTKRMFDVIYKPEDFSFFEEAKANVERASRENTQKEIAKAMLQLGKYPVEEIAVLTKLPLETIQHLSNELKAGEA